MSVTVDFDLTPFGQKIDDRHTNSVQTAGHFVRVFIVFGFVGRFTKLSAKLQHRHDAL